MLLHKKNEEELTLKLTLSKQNEKTLGESIAYLQARNDELEKVVKRHQELEKQISKVHEKTLAHSNSAEGLPFDMSSEKMSPSMRKSRSDFVKPCLFQPISRLSPESFRDHPSHRRRDLHESSGKGAPGSGPGPTTHSSHVRSPHTAGSYDLKNSPLSFSDSGAVPPVSFPSSSHHDGGKKEGNVTHTLNDALNVDECERASSTGNKKKHNEMDTHEVVTDEGSAGGRDDLELILDFTEFATSQPRGDQGPNHSHSVGSGSAVSFQNMSRFSASPTTEPAVRAQSCPRPRVNVNKKRSASSKTEVSHSKVAVAKPKSRSTSWQWQRAQTEKEKHAAKIAKLDKHRRSSFSDSPFHISSRCTDTGSGRLHSGRAGECEALSHTAHLPSHTKDRISEVVPNTASLGLSSTSSPVRSIGEKKSREKSRRNGSEASAESIIDPNEGRPTPPRMRARPAIQSDSNNGMSINHHTPTLPAPHNHHQLCSSPAKSNPPPFGVIHRSIKQELELMVPKNYTRRADIRSAQKLTRPAAINSNNSPSMNNNSPPGKTIHQAQQSGASHRAPSDVLLFFSPPKRPSSAGIGHNHARGIPPYRHRQRTTSVPAEVARWREKGELSSTSVLSEQMSRISAAGGRQQQQQQQQKRGSSRGHRNVQGVGQGKEKEVSRPAGGSKKTGDSDQALNDASIFRCSHKEMNMYGKDGTPPLHIGEAIEMNVLGPSRRSGHSVVLIQKEEEDDDVSGFPGTPPLPHYFVYSDSPRELKEPGDERACAGEHHVEQGKDVGEKSHTSTSITTCSAPYTNNGPNTKRNNQSSREGEEGADAYEGEVLTKQNIILPSGWDTTTSPKPSFTTPGIATALSGITMMEQKVGGEGEGAAAHCDGETQENKKRIRWAQEKAHIVETTQEETVSLRTSDGSSNFSSMSKSLDTCNSSVGLLRAHAHARDDADKNPSRTKQRVVNGCDGTMGRRAERKSRTSGSDNNMNASPFANPSHPLHNPFGALWDSPHFGKLEARGEKPIRTLFTTQRSGSRPLALSPEDDTMMESSHPLATLSLKDGSRTAPQPPPRSAALHPPQLKPQGIRDDHSRHTIGISHLSESTVACTSASASLSGSTNGIGTMGVVTGINVKKECLVPRLAAEAPAAVPAGDRVHGVAAAANVAAFHTLNGTALPSTTTTTSKKLLFPPKNLIPKSLQAMGSNQSPQQVVTQRVINMSWPQQATSILTPASAMLNGSRNTELGRLNAWQTSSSPSLIRGLSAPVTPHLGLLNAPN